MRRVRGKLIAIEGVDQAGKKTQAEFLAREVRKSGRRVSLWNFPDYRTPLGGELSAYLKGKIRLDTHALHLLYAANKWEAVEDLRARLDRGEVVVVNRYSPSNLAYGMAHDLPRSWLASLEEGLPKPDVVVVLDIPPRVSLERKRKGRDVHEANLSYLRRVGREYRSLARRFGWKIVDGAQHAAVVRQRVWEKVASTLS